MKKLAQEKAEKEYAEFMSLKETSAPSYLTEKVLQAVHSTLCPSPWKVLARLSAVVFFVGLLNLTLCPQFGVGFVRESGLFEYFMRFGHYTCKAFCGAFFLGSGLFLASLILSTEDVRVLRQHRFLQISSISSLALVLFVAAGGAVYFTIAAYWLLGAVIGGILCLEVGFIVRKQFA